MLENLKIFILLLGINLISLNLYGQTYNLIDDLKSKIFPSRKDNLTNEEIRIEDSLAYYKKNYLRIIYTHDTDSINLIEDGYKKYIDLQQYEINTAKYLYYKGRKHHIRQEVDSAVYYYEKSFYLIPDTYPGTHVQKYRILALNNLALIHHKDYNQPGEAIECLEDAIARSDKYFYPGYRQMAHAILCSVYRYQGQYQKAIELAEEALEHNAFNRTWNQGGDDYLHYILIRELAASLQECDDCNQKEKAFNLLNNTLQFYQSDKDIGSQAEVLSELAIAYPEFVTTSQQNEFMDEALQLSNQYGHVDVRNYVNYNHAVYLLDRDLFQKSKGILIDLVSSTLVSNAYGQRKIFRKISEVCTSMNQNDEALEYINFSNDFDGKFNRKYNSVQIRKLQSEADSQSSEALVGLLQKRNTIITSLVYLSVGLMVLSFILLSFAIYSRRRIRKQNIELQEANKSKNELFLILSHDLKGPIASFDNLGKRVSYLLQKKDYEGLQKFTEYFTTAGDSLKHTVTSLLDWSLSQKDNFILEPETLNVSHEIEIIIEELAYIISDKSIDLQVNLISSSKVICDRNSLQIIYRNLLHNAIKNSDAGDVVEVAMEEDKMLVISIKNKTSISSEDRLDRINLIINNPQKGVSMNMRTSGIGLYTASNLINYNHGKMTAKIEGGSIVIITSLPLAAT